ncbi:MAG: L-2-amino-thiazoline-4-carboxylic acid hydrolase [Dehalococcoidales bacterium]|nr:MAG: L-2-amino-thiazoline-4-carboxylic acid hydrolase [Dehalococcoidales bacterium]
MNTINNPEYYLSRKAEIMERDYDGRAEGWKQSLTQTYGQEFAEVIIKEARQWFEEFLPTIPYIGGDENALYTHQIIRSAEYLTFYEVMKARGKTAQEVGKIIYDALAEYIRHLPQIPGPELTPEFRNQQIAQAKKSQERRYPDDWVFMYVEGDGVEFDYGSDYIECGAQKLYHTHGTDEFLPFYCYLDFATHRTIGWGFSRIRTLSEGHERCEFRNKKGRETKKGWPPPFLKYE